MKKGTHLKKFKSSILYYNKQILSYKTEKKKILTLKPNKVIFIVSSI